MKTIGDIKCALADLNALQDDDEATHQRLEAELEALDRTMADRMQRIFELEDDLYDAEQADAAEPVE